MSCRKSIIVLMGGRSPEHEFLVIGEKILQIYRTIRNMHELTPSLLVLKAPFTSGITYSRLLDKIIEYALK